MLDFLSVAYTKKCTLIFQQNAGAPFSAVSAFTLLVGSRCSLFNHWCNWRDVAVASFSYHDGRHKESHHNKNEQDNQTNRPLLTTHARPLLNLLCALRLNILPTNFSSEGNQCSDSILIVRLAFRSAIIVGFNPSIWIVCLNAAQCWKIVAHLALDITIVIFLANPSR